MAKREGVDHAGEPGSAAISPFPSRSSCFLQFVYAREQTARIEPVQKDQRSGKPEEAPPKLTLRFLAASRRSLDFGKIQKAENIDRKFIWYLTVCVGTSKM